MTGAVPMTDAFHADQAARDRAVTDLVSPLAIEAGAGSGKTSLLVSRICALLAAGVPVQHIAAITFTRKAAGELRERVMTALDRAVRGVEQPRGATWSADDAAVTARFVAALDGLDRMYLGTIHGFCGRLLRERPVEAGLDPAFVELDEPQAMADRRAWWADFLAVRLRADDPALRALHAADVPLRRLESAFGRRVAQGDAEFPCEEWPDAIVTRELVESLVTLLDEGLALLRAAGADPASAPPETKWDPLARVVIELAHHLAPERAAHAVGALAEPGDAALDGQAWATIIERALDADPRKSNRVAITFWTGGARTDAAKAPAKAFVARWQAFLEGFAEEFVTAHRAHLHGLVMPILNEAATAFAAWRRDQGRLTFDDLLLGAESLLRSHPEARRDLAARWPHLLVDEFQDTDPVQAAVVAFLGAVDDDAEVTDWRAVRLRGGRFDAARGDVQRGTVVVVGDPKQGIYRFRRADIETYQAMVALLAREGDVVRLTRNFRSVPAIAAFVNRAFGETPDDGFPAEASDAQAAFAPMLVKKESPGTVYRLEVPVVNTSLGADAVAAAEAPRVAAWIAGEIAAGRRTPRQFMLLARTRKAIGTYVAALAECGVPAVYGGAEEGPTGSLSELRLILRLLADPGDALLTAAVLEGPCFACTPADLWAAHRAGLRPLELARGVPDPVRTAAADAPRVARVVAAFDTLARWRAAARTSPPDRLVERILDEGGVLVHAAMDPLGDGPAGSLLDVVTWLRTVSLDGRASLHDAIAALDDFLASSGAAPSLRRGRGGAVRVMTVHGAKGLEAEVVVLVQPTRPRDRTPSVVVRRTDAGVIGHMTIAADRGRVFAVPPGWDDLVADETRFVTAEEARLRYVAATRAAEELVIPVAVKGGDVVDGQLWGHFERCGHPLVPLPAGAGLDVPHASVAPAPAPPVHEALAAAALPTYARTTVTRAAREALRDLREGADDASPPADTDVEPALASAAPRRASRFPRPIDLTPRRWGTLVHRALEAAVRGRAGEALARAVRAIVRDEGVVDADGVTPRADVVGALVDGLARVMAEEPVWGDVARATTRLAEFPVRAMRRGDDGRPLLVEGVLDLAIEIDGGWTVIDWKTDDGDDAAWAEKERIYAGQLQQYADALAERTGTPVAWRLVRL